MTMCTSPTISIEIQDYSCRLSWRLELTFAMAMNGENQPLVADEPVEFEK